jgi:hypothetical protein
MANRHAEPPGEVFPRSWLTKANVDRYKSKFDGQDPTQWNLIEVKEEDEEEEDTSGMLSVDTPALFD